MSLAYDPLHKWRLPQLVEQNKSEFKRYKIYFTYLWAVDVSGKRVFYKMSLLAIFKGECEKCVQNLPDWCVEEIFIAVCSSGWAKLRRYVCSDGRLQRDVKSIHILGDGQSIKGCIVMPLTQWLAKACRFLFIIIILFIYLFVQDFLFSLWCADSFFRVEMECYDSDVHLAVLLWFRIYGVSCPFLFWCTDDSVCGAYRQKWLQFYFL